MRLSFWGRTTKVVDEENRQLMAPPWFRPLLALIMVGVATLGAAAAYWAADAEQEAILINQRVIGGRLLEVARWSLSANKYGIWNFLYSEQHNHIELGKQLARTADESRDFAAATAAKLDLQAEEQFSTSRLFQTFKYILLDPSNIDKYGVEGSLAKAVTSDLQSFGYGIDVDKPQDDGANNAAAPPGKSAETNEPDVGVWSTLDRRFEEAHSRVLRFSIAVAFFVLALVFFTFSDLSARYLWRAALLAGTGLAIAFGTAVFTIWNDRSFLTPTAIIAALSLVVALFAWWRRLFVAESDAEPAHQHELEPRSYRGPMLFMHHSATPTAQFTIALIAVTVFLSALVSFLYAQASATRERFAHEAYRYRVSMAERTDSRTLSTSVGMRSALNMLEQQVHCAALTGQQMFPPQGLARQVSEFGGIGAEMEVTGGKFRVVSVKPGGPAERAGVRAGDIIAYIDDNLFLGTLQQGVNSLRGRVNTPVRLRIVRDGEEKPIDLAITREKIVSADTTLNDEQELLNRNRALGCDKFDHTDHQTENDRAAINALVNADFDSSPVAGATLYYEILYPSTEGNPGQFYALADGNEEASAAWNRKASVYLANLTLFAIGLYLFGQALGVGARWQARTFLFFGMGFVILSSGWAMGAWLMPGDASSNVPAQCKAAVGPNESDRIKAAAHFYGLGEAAYWAAASPDDYKKAAEFFDCSVKERPLFVRAQTMRLWANEDVEGTQRHDSYIPVPSPLELKKFSSLEDERLKALRLEGETPAGELSAFYEVTLGLLYKDRSAVRAGLVQLQKLVDSDESLRRALPGRAQIGTAVRTQHASRYFNLGVGLLADGQPEQAEKVFRHAIDDLGAAEDWNTVIEVETDLKMFIDHCESLFSSQQCSGLVQVARGIKEELVSGKAVNSVAAPSISVKNMSIVVTPSTAAWAANVEPVGSNLDGHKLTLIWYALEPAYENAAAAEMRVWKAIRGLSGAVDIKQLSRGPAARVEWSSDYFAQQSFCLPEGQYTVEVYLDGHLQTEPDFKNARLGKFNSYLSRYMNMNMCLPEGWSVQSFSWVMPFRALFGTDKKTPIGVMYTMYADRSRPADTLKGEDMVQMLSFIAGFGKSPDSDLARATLTRLLAFRNCSDGFPAGSLPHKEWVTTEGFVQGLIITDPGVDRRDVCQLMDSFSTYFTPETLERAKSG